MAAGGKEHWIGPGWRFGHDDRPSCFHRLPASVEWVWTDHGANPLSAAGSSLAATDLRLAELRSFSEIPVANALPRVLDGKARRPAAFVPDRPLQVNQACRVESHQRRIPLALTARLARARLSGPGERRACIARPAH